MDWRAKSQSRSRSRAPGESMMDWRAQSRSRSRAPAFRTPMPPPEVFPAVAHASRFRSDSTTSTTTINESAVLTLAASLGLSPNNDLFGNSNGGFDGSGLLGETHSNSTSTTTSSSSTNKVDANISSSSSINGAFSFPADHSSPDPSDPNLVAIEDTLNHLISLQSIATSPQSQSIPSPLSPWSIPSQQGGNNHHQIGSLVKENGFGSITGGGGNGNGEVVYGSHQSNGGEYGYSANGNQSLLSAQEQLHQLLSQVSFFFSFLSFHFSFSFRRRGLIFRFLFLFFREQV